MNSIIGKRRNPEREGNLDRKTTALIVCLFVFCQRGFGAVGTSGWVILDKAAMADARRVASVSVDYFNLAGVLYSPALLGVKNRREIAIVSEAGFAGDGLGGILYSSPVRGGAWAAGIAYYDAGPVELNWIENGVVATETVSLERDYLGIVSYGHRFRQMLFLGGSLKGAMSEIAQRKSALAFAADVGAAVVPLKNLTVSLSLMNMGQATKFLEKESPLPFKGRAGASYLVPLGNLYLLGGAMASYDFNNERTIPEAGLEFGSSFISVSAGYIANFDNTAVDLGIDVFWKDIEFTYSYVPGMYLGPVHRLNLGFHFPAPSPQKPSRKKTFSNVR